MTQAAPAPQDSAPPLADSDWPLFGWQEDIRPALKQALQAGRAAVLATLFRVEGSAPRGPGAQMLFDGPNASGYFSGDCIESDVARHAAEVMADGTPRHLIYGAGSPWIDIRLRCGGTLHIFVERIAPDSGAAYQLLACAEARTPALWISDGLHARVEETGDAPLLTASDGPITIARRYDPRRRLIISGGDPTALALAQLGAEAQFETFLVRTNGPASAPPIDNIHYLRSHPVEALKEIGVDGWTAFVGATHDGELDAPACAYALSRQAGYVGLLGAASRLPGRLEAIRAAGISDELLARLHAPAGKRNLGKAPWPIAIGIVTEVMEVMNQAAERA